MKQKGFATLEILLAMTIIVMAISTILPLVSGGQSVSVSSQTDQEALYKAQDLLERARADARQDFNLVNPIGPIFPTPPDIYTKSLTVTVNPSDFFTKVVTSIVSWIGENGQNLSASLSTVLTNPSAVNGGDTCSSVLVGDWTSPQIVSYEFGKDMVGDPNSGFPITSIQVFNEKMYVTINNTHSNNFETFFILDTSNSPLIPVILGKLDNSPGVISEGLKSVAIDGKNYAYVANAYDSSPGNCLENHNCAQLQIIDISNSSSPSITRNFKINSFTTGDKLANGQSILYKDGIIYLGLSNASNGSELYILDVGGNLGGSPTNPVILSNIEIGTGVNAIFVKGNYLYIASPNSQELQIYNISNVSSPAFVGYFNSPSGDGNGKSLFLVGSKLYLGKTVPNAGNDFHILDNSNPEASLPQLGGINSSSSINGILVRDYLAFLITSGGQIQVWRIDHPSNIIQYASPIMLPPGSEGGLRGTASDCEEKYIYVASQSNNEKGYISIITGGP